MRAFMSLTRKIAGHSVFYGSAQILVMLSGIISMPILTRILSTEAYGLMNVIGVTLMLSATLFTGGLRHAALRHYGEFRERGNLPRALGTYLTLVLILAVAGLGATMGVFRGLHWLDVLPDWALAASLIAAPLVFIRLVFAGTAAVYRMREQVIRYNLYEVATKYVAMGLCVWLVLTMTPRVLQYYRGLVIGEALVLLVLCLSFYRSGKVRLSLSREVSGELFRYGLPLMAGSLAAIAFRMGDRYVIKIMLDARQVGLYSVGAQLAGYTCTAVVSGFQFALVPVIMNAWNSGDRDRAREALGNLVRYFALIAFPMALGLVAVRFGLIRLVASLKFVPTEEVMPYVVAAALMAGFATPLAMGLQFAKRTGVIAALLASMAALNVVLNYFLLPAYGIIGAGIATMVCNALYVVLGHHLSRKYCRVRRPWPYLLRYALAAFAMFVVVIYVQMDRWTVLLGVRVALGAVVYGVLVLGLDGQLRSGILRVVRRGRSSQS